MKTLSESAWKGATEKVKQGQFHSNNLLAYFSLSWLPQELESNGVSILKGTPRKASEETAELL